MLSHCCYPSLPKLRIADAAVADVPFYRSWFDNSPASRVCLAIYPRFDIALSPPYLLWFASNSPPHFDGVPSNR